MVPWKRRRSQLLDEIETHISIEIDENIAAGMSPDEARRSAMRKFGNPDLAVDRSREIWGWLKFERLLQDIRFAVRTLRKASGYTAALVLTLALGLGSVTAMLAIVDSVLLQPVALPDSGRLAVLYEEGEPNGTHSSNLALPYNQIDALARDAHSIEGIAGYNAMARPVAAPDGVRVTPLIEVTPDFFRTLGPKPQSGRFIGSNDSSAPVVVVNSEFWHDRLNSDPRAVGSAIRVSGVTRTIIGILPPRFHFPQGNIGAAVFIPIAVNAKGEDEFLNESASTIVRLRPGVSRQQALTEARAIITHVDSSSKRTVHLRSYQDFVTGDEHTPLLALLGGVLLLLIIACANAANLQIGRAAGRMGEMNVRSALGASFGRILQQLVTESVLVSLAGASVGAAIAYAVVALLRHAYGEQYARFDELSIHPLVLASVALLAIAVGIAASIAPAVSIRRKASGKPVAPTTTRASRVPGMLVSLQVALTCVLLVAAGLFVRTFQSLENVKLGFDPAGVTTFVILPDDQRQDTELSRQIETRLLRRLQALPGVQSVTYQSQIPFSSYGVGLNGTTDVEGRAFQPADSAYYSLVSTDFVRTSGIHLLKGRAFQTQDETSAAISVLVNEAFVSKFFGARNPVGASIKFHRSPTDTDADMPFLQPMTILGVVENEVQSGDLGAPYQPMAYVDYLQLPRGSLLTMVFSMAAQYAVRSNLPQSTLDHEIRSALKQEAPTFAEMSLQPMQQSIQDSLNQRRLAFRLVAGFGAVALILSAVGLYGVLAYSVALRRREIGVRIALGSSRARVGRLVLRQAGNTVLLGLIPGLAGAWAAAHLIRSFLFGVQLLDPGTLLSAALVMIAVAAFAALRPAMQAAFLDPVKALRLE
jgi:predicted permease